MAYMQILLHAYRPHADPSGSTLTINKYDVAVVLRLRVIQAMYLPHKLEETLSHTHTPLSRNVDKISKASTLHALIVLSSFFRFLAPSFLFSLPS